MKKETYDDMENFQDDDIFHDESKWDMEIFTKNQSVLEDRKTRYVKEGLNYYPGAKCITSVAYKKIKKEFDAGNKDVLKQLFEESIGDIINVVAVTYARYDVEKYVPFEEGLSFVLEKLCKYISNYEFIPKFRGEYINNVLLLGTYRIITRAYVLGKTRSCETSMKQSDLIWHIDKRESDSLSVKDINVKDLRSNLDKIMKRLNHKEQEAIKLSYGLNTGEKLSYSKVSKKLGVSSSGVAYRVDSALRKLKNHEKLDSLKDYLEFDINTEI